MTVVQNYYYHQYLSTNINLISQASKTWTSPELHLPSVDNENFSGISNTAKDFPVF